MTASPLVFRVVALAGLAACLAWPAPMLAWSSPQLAIERFLAFEFAGGRLDNPGGFLASRVPYLRMPVDYDEPGWDIVEYADAYTVENVHCESARRCTAEVRFVHDRDDPSRKLRGEHLRLAPQSVRYVIVEDNGEWLVEPPDGPPRISSARFD